MRSGDYPRYNHEIADGLGRLARMPAYWWRPAPGWLRSNDPETAGDGVERARISNVLYVTTPQGGLEDLLMYVHVDPGGERSSIPRSSAVDLESIGPDWNGCGRVAWRVGRPDFPESSAMARGAPGCDGASRLASARSVDLPPGAAGSRKWDIGVARAEKRAEKTT